MKTSRLDSILAQKSTFEKRKSVVSEAVRDNDKDVEKGACIDCTILCDNKPYKFDLAIITDNNGTFALIRYVYINKELNKYFTGMYSGGQVGNGVRVNSDLHDLDDNTILAFGYKKVVEFLAANKLKEIKEESRAKEKKESEKK